MRRGFPRSPAASPAGGRRRSPASPWPPAAAGAAPAPPASAWAPGPARCGTSTTPPATSASLDAAAPGIALPQGGDARRLRVGALGQQPGQRARWHRGGSREHERLGQAKTMSSMFVRRQGFLQADGVLPGTGVSSGGGARSFIRDRSPASSRSRRRSRIGPRQTILARANGHGRRRAPFPARPVSVLAVAARRASGALSRSSGRNWSSVAQSGRLPTSTANRASASRTPHSVSAGGLIRVGCGARLHTPPGRRASAR